MRQLLCVVSVLVWAAVADKSITTNNAFFTWDGFDYTWERTVPLTGIHYGHKLGNLASYYDNEQV
jgi:hypothetical protein